MKERRLNNTKWGCYKFSKRFKSDLRVQGIILLQELFKSSSLFPSETVKIPILEEADVLRFEDKVIF